MSFQLTKQVISTFMCVILVPLAVPADAAGFLGDQTSPQTSATTATSAPTIAPLTSDQLEALVAPIALYPDALVAQVLAAASYADQVAFADDWLSQNGNLKGNALLQAIDQQSWDPSVKALTQFPTVLHDLAKNLSWTSNLGQAFSNQQTDVMTAVQVMRAKAQAAGTLKSSPQIKVVQQSPQTIVIQPASSQVVYVPQYNPAVVYGSPYVVPLYTPPVAVAAATVSFGTGVAIGAAFGGAVFVGGAAGGVSWGFGSWGCSWGGGGGGGNVTYNHNTYVNKSTINKNSNNNNNSNNRNNNNHPWNKNTNNENRTAGNRANTPNGGENGNHGLIGGKGGVQHDPQQHVGNEQRPGNDQRASNDQHPGNNQRAGNEQQRDGADGARQRGGDTGANRERASMSGDGNRARTESNRGRTSMNHGGAQKGEARGGGEHGGGGARGR